MVTVFLPPLFALEVVDRDQIGASRRPARGGISVNLSAVGSASDPDQVRSVASQAAIQPRPVTILKAAISLHFALLIGASLSRRSRPAPSSVTLEVVSRPISLR
nr:hypothetical protein Iba_chr10fCG4590 [Ipomoea batatas]